MPERIAFLVIHGIGQERPYETLDRFTRNLKNCLPGNWSVEPRLDRASDPTHVSAAWIRSALRLTPQDGSSIPYKSDPASSYKDITLYEYYWAPITQDKITYRGSLLFLFKAGLKPFLNLSSNVIAISQANGGKVGSVFVREVWRQVCIFLPLLALLAWLLIWMTSPNTFSYFHDFRPNTARVLVLCALAIRYLFIYTCIHGLTKPINPDQRWRKKWWRPVLLIGVLGHLVLWPLWLAAVARFFAHKGTVLAGYLPWLHLFGHRSALLRQVAKLVTFPSHHSLLYKASWFFLLDPSFAAYFHPMIALLLILWLRFLFADIIGDIAVYANADTFSTSYAARTQILEECSSALTAILLERDNAGKPKYDRVLIAAHSLGSVIAYDTMNQIRNVVRTAASTNAAVSISGVSTALQVQDLERLRGLATFGCPLNKFFYFFRDMGDQTLTLRTQVLDLLHGFRLNPVIAAAVPPPVFNYTPPPEWVAADAALNKNFTWINVYSPMDPISGRILFYVLNPEDQLSLSHMTPFVAHVQYWERSDFYTFLSSKLL